MENNRKELINSLIKKAQFHCDNIEKTFNHMKDNGLKICSNCGCTIYPNKTHKC